MTDRPVILGSDHVKRAMSDPNFFTSMPEFLPVKKKMEAARDSLSAGGCAPCKRRRAVHSANSDFMSIVSKLPEEGLKRMKNYLGVSRLLVRSVNRSSGNVEMKEI